MNITEEQLEKLFEAAGSRVNNVKKAAQDMGLIHAPPRNAPAPVTPPGGVSTTESIGGVVYVEEDDAEG